MINIFKRKSIYVVEYVARSYISGVDKYGNTYKKSDANPDYIVDSNGEYPRAKTNSFKEEVLNEQREHQYLKIKYGSINSINKAKEFMNVVYKSLEKQTGYSSKDIEIKLLIKL